MRELDKNFIELAPIIGAGSVATKDVPDNAVVVGCFAKVIKYLDGERFKN